MDRRRFLSDVTRGTAGATAALTLSRRLSAGASPPSERVRAGFVGVGGRAGALLEIFSSQDDVDIVTLAEIDQRRLPKAIDLVTERKGKPPSTTGDFRTMLDDDSIDVLVVGTPDHWHAIPTIMACQAGKDVYVEKPDSHNVVEGQRMVEALRRHNRIVQMGTQARSDPMIFEALDYIRQGHLGRVLVAKAWESTKQGSIGNPPDGQPPEGVDYDTWLGPAPKRPFNPRRFHSNWRWFFDYGTGDVGNDGVHRIDYARWALDTAIEAQGGKPAGMPTKVVTVGGKWYFDDMQQWPDTLQVCYEYPADGDAPGRILTYEMRVWAPYRYNGDGEGAILYGDQGYIVIANHRWRAFSPDDRVVAEGRGTMDATPHVRNFLDCVKSRQRPNADLETVGHPSSLLCHTANVAWRLGRQVEFDHTSETFPGDDEANVLRTRPEYRKPWTLPEV
ncbi:MAG: Gfo/Idh/MocA family oxidoreductase [Planctomycetales bacterium]|nr:Gfo/Idh/MocA family oxidoreductase [Planctomycetales bacterium]